MVTTQKIAGDEGERQREHAESVRTMFARIARRYDLLNHLLSANVDRRWRRLVAERVAAHAGVAGARVLDVACGTGDLSFTISDRAEQSEVTGLDFCRPMLDVARRKADERNSSIPFVEGDALALPFDDGTFDAVTIAFGLRNLASVERGLAELFRVTKPGGLVCVLEFSRPVVPVLRELFGFYFTRVLPRVGGMVSGSRGAYEYLPDSVTRFPDQARLAEMLRAAGFERVGYRNLTGGIAALHTGTRPAA
ncbi:MAG TPA: bifunctional demethylmenaquinone methyltransferase/2-methoxy-6-polyprenyl-1,4-benzoquinol methylase UbiE [Pyrinomonadaceae bacterium]|nr:bifunctional demethylmenaquinone methyltransferase/2-methoxy-6-polyprenyl-1,4-benzoquinol methylase UbiE [Pyrinomonadaceae bacterium]